MSNPLTELPFIGWLVALLDQALADIGFPVWIAQMLELLAIVILATVLFRLVTQRFLPWFGTAAVTPAVGLLKVLRLLLLLPQLAVAYVQDWRERAPGALVYAYGDGVMRAADVGESAIRKTLPRLDLAKRVPRIAFLLLLAGLFLAWNASYCTEALGPQCVSPVAEWKLVATGWFEASAG